ncbi:MAG: sigma-70 family RNA polymerase sigma factor [Planctomycetes bacterium]|nr:sigma-70 family RNA polymerase sigma factor [Planctomycetota bacterium]
MDADPRLPADLARETEMLRRIARGVLFEPGLAEDAVQDAWLAALRAPRSSVTGGWLGESVKRIARGIRRRETRFAARERAAPRRDHTASAAETAERIELLRTLLAALHELDEPYRTAVRLRLLDDLTPREISVRLDLPLETVRTHVRRGIERMRAKLDAEHRASGGGQAGRDRRDAFLAALVPLVGADALKAGLAAHASFGTLGGVLVSAKLKWIVVLIVLASVGAWWRWSSATNAVRPAEVAEVLDSRRALPAAPDAELESTFDALAAPVAAQPDARASVAERASSTATWRIGGRTLLGDLAPLPGVVVTIRVREGYDGKELLERELVSDEHGTFALALEPPTTGVTVEIRGERPDCIGFPNEMFFAPGSAASERMDVRFYPLDVTVRGHVLDAEGRPIAKARIHGVHHVVESDAQGSFAAPASSLLTPREFVATADGYEESSVSLDLRRPGELDDVVFRMRPGVRVAGRVLDESDRPLAGARVDASFSRHAETLTDSDGRFELTTAPARGGWFRVTASLEGRPAAVYEHDDRDAPTEDLVLRFERGFDVVGRVVDELGAPIEAAMVGLGEWESNHRVLTDADGNFALRTIAKRERKFVVMRDGFTTHARTLEFAPDGGHEPLIVVLERGFRIRGHIRDPEGRPLRGAMVYVVRGDQQAPLDGARADADGVFEFRDAPQVANLSLEGHREGWLSRRQLLEGNPLEVELVLERIARITGRVIDASSGAPVPRFRVRFVEPELLPGDERLGNFRADWWDTGIEFAHPEGRWDTGNEGLRPNRVIGLEVRAADHGVAIVPRVVTRVEGEQDELVIELGPELAVTGRVVERASGRALAGVRVRTFSSREPLQFFDRARLPEATTDAAGEFRLAPMPAEPVSLYVEADGFAPRVDGPFDPGRGETRRAIELTNGATLRGRVLDVAGEPLAGARVHLGNAVSAERPNRSWTRTTDADGAFEFRGLPPDEYYVTRAVPYRDGALFDSQQLVKLAEDEVATVDVRPPGRLVLRGELRASVELPGDLQIQATRSIDGATVVAIAHGTSFELVGLAPGRWYVSAAWYDGEGEHDLSGSVEIELGDAAPAPIAIELAPPKR